MWIINDDGFFSAVQDWDDNAWVSQQRDHAHERLSVLNDAWLLFNHWPNGELFEEDVSYE